MTQTFLTNITVMQDADGIKGIFTVPTENGKKVLAMAEYVNRELARFEAKRYFKDLDNIPEDLDMIFWMLPAEDVAPVRHGRWMHEETESGFPTWKCSRCGHGTNYDPNGIDLYCYHCGAKMDGGSDNA